MIRRPTPFRRISWIFVGVHLVCVFVPLLVIVAWAFSSSWPWPSLVPEAFSSRGLEEIFAPSQHLGAVLAQSIGIALAVAILSTAVAAFASRALAFYQFKGKSLFRFSTVLPFLIPATVFAMGVQVLFIHAGLAGTVVGVVIAHTIVALPYAIAILGDVMAAAGTRLEQQARIAGAGRFRAFIHVQLPLLLPGILSASAMSYILSFSQYFLTLLIGGGAVRTFAVTMFPYLASGDRTIASAYGVVFLAVTFGVFLLFELLIKRFTPRFDNDYFNG